ncbi:MAG: alpha/beta hydrolase-fold protein [Methylococcaceae bacterium]|nr:alpha/beta hydrolase-fold protein [Prolixibacteraceae bacterium]
MKRLLFLLLCIAPWLQTVKAQDPLLPESISLSNSSSASSLAPIVTSRIIWSDKVQDNFKIYISLPPGYDSLRFPKYPVVYFLDGGGGSFHTINTEYMEQGLIPEVITIGIGYPAASQRNRDYTYGFANFYKFMKQELIPQMDKEFNIDINNRTLFGHSYGGICVLFTMFEYYDYNDILFHNLIAASPSIWYPDGQLAYTKERNLYYATQILPVNLYMSVGSLEGSMVSDLNRMQQTLIGHNYDYFNMSCHIYEGKDHSTNKEITFREGVQWVLHQEIQIPTKVQEKVWLQGPIAAGLYPNPATDAIHLMISPVTGKQNIKGHITDIHGKEVQSFEQPLTGNPEIQIAVNELPKGIYLINITNGQEQQTLKFIK